MGAPLERASHQAFGAIESDFRPDRRSAQREQYKFTGKEEDLEVGLTYFGARYYHARLNRWISPDPLTIHGLGADLNPYAYVSGRALAAVDPFGLCAECDGPDGPTKGPDGTELAEVHAHSQRPSAAADAQRESSGMSFAAFAETLPSVRHFEQVVRAEWANGPIAQGMAAINLARRDGAARTAGGLLRGGFGHNGNRLGQGVNLGDLAFGPPRSDAERVGARIASHIDDLVIRIASGYVGALAGLAMEGAAIANAEGAAAGAGTRAAGTAEASPLAGSIRGVNPTAATENCVACSIATDATLGGSPASAIPGGPFSVVESVTTYRPGAVGIPANGVGGIQTMMTNAGPGARGIVWGTRGTAPGHVFNVVNQGGTIRFLDGQIGGAAAAEGFETYYLFRTH